MKIFIYGDSNTFGQKPNLDGYSKNAKIERYDKKDIWWSELNDEVCVNGLSGRAVCSDSFWLEGRNASKTIENDLKNVEADVCVVFLGTNDLKSGYNLNAEQIAKEMQKLLEIIEQKLNSKIVLIGPPTIKEGNVITDKYYVGAQKKSKELNMRYSLLAKEKNFSFVLGKNLEVGEDGEHLTKEGHKMLGQKVKCEIEKIKESQNRLQERAFN